MNRQDAWERQRAKMRRVLEADPLPVDKKRKATEIAQYMVARLQGRPAKMPAWMSSEQAAALEQALSTQDGLDAAMAMALKGYTELAVAAKRLPDEG